MSVFSKLIPSALVFSNVLAPLPAQAQQSPGQEAETPVIQPVRFASGTVKVTKMSWERKDGESAPHVSAELVCTVWSARLPVYDLRGVKEDFKLPENPGGKVECPAKLKSGTATIHVSSQVFFIPKEGADYSEKHFTSMFFVFGGGENPTATHFGNVSTVRTKELGLNNLVLNLSDANRGFGDSGQTHGENFSIEVEFNDAGQ